MLPFVLSASLLLNVLGGHRPVNLGIWQTRLTRIIATTALMVGPVMINVPSALLVYWIGSSLSAYVQNYPAGSCDVYSEACGAMQAKKAVEDWYRSYCHGRGCSKGPIARKSKKRCCEDRAEISATEQEALM